MRINVMSVMNNVCTFLPEVLYEHVSLMIQVFCNMWWVVEW